MEDPNNIIWLSILTALVSFTGAIATIASNLYKARSERKKIENEGESAIAEAADSIANGARVNNDMLLTRLIEMETREKARDKRETELLEKVRALELSLADWQDWARRLVHQLKSHGFEPVPFKILPKTGPLDAKAVE